MSLTTASPQPQGIASAYMGNPGALQKKIQKDQQANPGMPPDLKELMALDIVTNVEDAAKRQQALNALNQMAPAGQQPPTVAASIQEQAKQKLQAQALQQQRQQQGLMALAQQNPGAQVPERTPQPKAQPQGIDELPVEMTLAGGGIVAFAKGDDVPYETRYDKMNRENREREAREMDERIAQIRESGNEAGAVPYGEQMRSLGQAIDRVVPDPVQLFRRLVGDPSLARETAPVGLRGTQGDQAGDYPTQGTPRPAPAATPAPKPAADLAALAAQKAAPAAGRTAPAGKPAQLDPAAKAYQDLLLKGMQGNPDEAAAAAVARAKEAYGAPDTSQYDRLIAELEGRKKQFNAPQGMDALVEYARQYEQGPRWYEQGQKAGRSQIALDKERQAQQFELTKQGIEAAQKKADTERGYKKELFGLGEKERDEVEKRAQDMAKEYGLDDRQTKLLANQLAVARINADARIAGGGGGDKQTLNELKALQTSLKDQLKDPRMMGPKGDPLRAQLADVNSAIAKMAGLDTMAGAPGAQSPGGTMSGWGKAQVVK